ncbi:hypothetical protein MSAN_00123200 [Mycena sanguinolenta]|uniref:Protein kinase domain-containing protein n=1 Tax=Mycena sanguinolenta TaxID=230812 RepID=A0A8H7DMX2_9AGAR|nr:hypothetical protein MSAN_00123200 [Mycena sanguinolenta]
MNDHSQPEPEFTHSSTCDVESPSHASGMFSNSQHFTVTGGTFTNITKNYAAAPSLPPDLRMIPLGDIDLQQQIRVDNYTGVAYFQRQRACVRRVHSAKAIIAGRKSKVTVAIYQGNDAEQEWRDDVAKHMSLRHPNIVQICGAASSNGLHATLFNDDLIPLRAFLDGFHNSPVLTVYIYACCNSDFSVRNSTLSSESLILCQAAYRYIISEFQQTLNLEERTNWIRRSTGRLCTELVKGPHELWLPFAEPELPGLSVKHALCAGTQTITTFIDSLTLEQYYHICYWNLKQDRHIALSASTTMTLGAVFHCPSDPLEDSVEITFLPSAEVLRIGGWRTSEHRTGEVMPNGWTRPGMYSTTLCPFSFTSPVASSGDAWLSQANHIFRRLNILSNFEDYGTAATHSLYLG